MNFGSMMGGGSSAGGGMMGGLMGGIMGGGGGPSEEELAKAAEKYAAPVPAAEPAPAEISQALSKATDGIAQASDSENPAGKPAETPSWVKSAEDFTGKAKSMGSFGEDQGAKNQQEAMGKIGNAVGAIANFYSGNWLGAANNVRGLTGGQK